MFFGSRKIIALFALASFMLVAFLSLNIMMHGVDGTMSGDCPLSVASTALCPLNTLNIVAHHVSAYRGLFNVLVGISIIFAVLFVYFQFVIVSSTQRLFYNVIPDGSVYDRITISWLSLLENSPSQ